MHRNLPHEFHSSPHDAIEDSSRLHVWLCDLDREADSFCRWDLLSDDERQRASRLKSDELRRRFVTSRDILRSVIGKCLGLSARDVRFAADTHGKPGVSGSKGSTVERLQFNLSHSENLLLIAVTFDHGIGVDIEMLRDDFDPLAVAETHFSSREVAWLKSLPAIEHFPEFYRLWTMREAVAKCEGAGIVRSNSRRDIAGCLDGRCLLQCRWTVGNLSAMSAVCVNVTAAPFF